MQQENLFSKFLHHSLGHLEQKEPEELKTEQIPHSTNSSSSVYKFLFYILVTEIPSLLKRVALLIFFVEISSSARAQYWRRIAIGFGTQIRSQCHVDIRKHTNALGHRYAYFWRWNPSVRQFTIKVISSFCNVN